MVHWTFDSNAADVLSLGPRTAGRLMRVGVRTAAELMAAKPQAVAARLADERIDLETLAAWQRETRLMIDVPELPPIAARLLAAIGYGVAARVAFCAPTELMTAIERWQTEHRSSWLREDELPSIAMLSEWILLARASTNAAA